MRRRATSFTSLLALAAPMRAAPCSVTCRATCFWLSVGTLWKFAPELVKARVDVIMAGGDFGIRAAQQATATIPIVGFTDDMLGSRLVNSLAHPGGNTTGVSLLATDLDGKRQEILIEAATGLRHMAAFADSGTSSPQQLQALRDAAHARGVELSIHQVAKAEEIAPAIDAAKASNAAALNILASPLLFANRRKPTRRRGPARPRRAGRRGAAQQGDEVAPSEP